MLVLVLVQAAKRALYILLQHAEVAVDMVVEGDIGPTLNSYKLLILADTHVSQVSTRILGRRTAPVTPFLIPCRVPYVVNPRS